MSDFYLIAEIKSAYGSDGFVSIISHSNRRERFFELNKVYIEVFNSKKEFFVETVKIINELILIKFKNFNNINDIDFLIGKNLYVDNDNLVKLEDNSFFIHDLIGSQVFRKSILYGKIIDVLLLPANDVFVIKNLAGEEELIPAILDYIEGFDAEKKILTLKPEGDIYDTDED